MMKPTRLAAFWLAVVFVVGTLFGYVAHGFYSERTARAGGSKDHRARILAKLQKELLLSPEQLAQVTAIFNQTHLRFEEIKGRMEPEFEAIRHEHRQRIMAILTPEQQPKYQKILGDLDASRRKREAEKK